MKATELRIGNSVLLDTGSTLPSIHDIKPLDIAQLSDGMPKGCIVEPIPLTEEWLLKFGFEGDKSKIWFTNNLISINPSKGYIHLEHSDDSDQWITLDICCEHVHQLQNLYFALTSTELILQHGE